MTRRATRGLHHPVPVSFWLHLLCPNSRPSYTDVERERDAHHPACACRRRDPNNLFKYIVTVPGWAAAPLALNTGTLEGT